jgi:hypothetical protein
MELHAHAELPDLLFPLLQMQALLLHFLVHKTLHVWYRDCVHSIEWSDSRSSSRHIGTARCLIDGARQRGCSGEEDEVSIIKKEEALIIKKDFEKTSGR